MTCQICGSGTARFLKKTFTFPFAFDVDYRKCGNCGLVYSATHAEMSASERDRLNSAYHAQTLGENNPNDPNWHARLTAQCASICAAGQAALIDRSGDWLDYGCGNGELAAQIGRTIQQRVCTFDRYGHAGSLDYNDPADIPNRHFGLTISTAVFEHLQERAEWDAIDRTVARNGVLAVHTLVREAIPANADWFYFLPVHSTFFTNKSMSLLHRQWGYTCSVYDVDARLWFWFKQPAELVSAQVTRANALVGRNFLYAEGFLDYWK